MYKISYKDYLNKVYGGWLGKCVGGVVGTAVENNKMLMDFTWDNIWPETIPFNDDLDIQVLWLDVLEKKGPWIASRDLADAWMNSVMYVPNEYGYFRRNHMRKIYPPVSGWYNNEFFKESMGSPIRSEIWGFVCPGNPELAAEYASKDAVLDHQNESVWGEQFFAAIEARAFFEKDIQKLIREELRWINKDSELYACITFIMDAYEQGKDWIKAREEFLYKFVDIDASKARVNIAFTVLALIYGKNDFGKTILTAVNCGYDTDCTAATAGAILGQILGADHIPEEYIKPVGEELVLGIVLERESNKVIDLAADTCKAGLEVSRVRNSETALCDVPDGMELPKREIPSADLEIELDYCGLPAISLGDSKIIKLKVKNRTQRTLEGRIQMEIPQKWIVDAEEKNIILKAFGEIRMPFVVTVPEDMEEIDNTNIIKVSISDNEGNMLAVDEYGIAGAGIYKILGPFWDIYDTTKHEKCPWYNDEKKGRPVGGVDYSNFVSLDRAYVDEKAFDFSKGRIISAYEDKIDFCGLLPSHSPCCVYLEQIFNCPEERQLDLVIGNNDGFRIWFNDTEIAVHDDHRYYTPFNYFIQVRFKKGKNRIVIKLLKRDKALEFSLGVRSSLAKENFWWNIDHSTSV